MKKNKREKNPLEIYLKAQYKMGPPLPNSFWLARQILGVEVELRLRIEPDSHPEKWNPDWGSKGERKCYMSEVEANTTVDGKPFSNSEYLGGSWEKNDEVSRWIKDEVHGYLPQMTEEALRGLGRDLYDARKSGAVEMDLIDRACDALKWLMEVRYEEQQRIYAPVHTYTAETAPTPDLVNCFYMLPEEVAELI